ncbi:MAG: DNA mismatch repair protein MutS [Epsilonproteobacteria bacterium]|nr:DNA mismatch repair protein MutS [Campylobacterota bacterium]|tara:strand:- start:329 stop:2902 length:2574 start_codon:yes stop_codon:yes gene_type:complete
MDFSNISGLTPLMKQYVATKQEYSDSLLLFQVGDFYELFFDDAKKVSEYLGITLTKRGEIAGKPIPLCGFPVHAIEHYIPKLVKGGFKVALCDQLEPATTGKMVARGVTNVLTPGTLTSENLLDAKSNSYLFSFFPTKSGYGLLFSELLTSQLHATVLPYGASRQLETELYRFLPDEILMLAGRGMGEYAKFFKQRGFYTTQHTAEFDEALLDQEKSWIMQQFDTQSAQSVMQDTSILCATILWKQYLEKNQQAALQEFKTISWYKPESFLMLDGATQKNLDIVKNSFDGSRSHTLFSFVDKAVTSMGSRMIKRWLLAPLVEQNLIEQRQNVIQELLQNPITFQTIQNLLSRFGDMQRIVGRISLDKASVQDYVNLATLLQVLPELLQVLRTCSSEMLQAIVNSLSDFSELEQLLSSACDDDIESDYIIKSDFDAELDRMRDLVQNSSQNILKLEQQEQHRTSISSLKIRQNNVHGYYIEVTKANVAQVPQDYIEQQSLVNRKRYVTKELQALQFEIMQARTNFAKREKDIFMQVKQKTREYIHDLRLSAQAIATLDALVGFARVSYEYGYIRPSFNQQGDICIQDGKHPIISALSEQQFIANDTTLTDEQNLWIVTGPNMGGKSTYLRQVALICLLAQTGCFVPAKQASLPLLDRIFTRIGAGDHLAQGKSTFLVEMEETAQICLQATNKSLVILDEVGRGTSTYDGLALAQAIVEYLVQQVQARCLFATHYHELTSLQDMHPGIVSYYMDSKKTKSGIVFLHKIVRGVADGSFGIEVAKLAQLPSAVIKRAQVVLKELHDVKHDSVPSTVDTIVNVVDESTDTKIIETLQSLDIDAMTPRQAQQALWDLKDLLEE